MRLLAPNELKTAKNIDETKRIARSVRLSKVLSDHTKEADLKVQFIAEKQKLEREFGKFAQGIAEKRESLLREIESLEDKKRIASAPLTEWEAELQDQEDDLDAKDLLLQARERKLIIDTEEVRKQNEILLHAQRYAGTRSFELANREKRISQGESALANSLKLFLTKEKSSLEAVDKRTVELSERELQLNQEAQKFKILKQELDADKLQVARDKRKLADQRATLDSAWQELNIKQNNGRS